VCYKHVTGMKINYDRSGLLSIGLEERANEFAKKKKKTSAVRRVDFLETLRGGSFKAFSVCDGRANTQELRCLERSLGSINKTVETFSRKMKKKR
jgi:hypothetical protein